MYQEIKCSCGDDGRYQNMRSGQFVWTCGKRGCLKEKPLTYAANTKYCRKKGGDMKLTKYDVFEATLSGSTHFFSNGITRVFGENKVIHTEGGTIFASVQPAFADTSDLKKIGHIFV